MPFPNFHSARIKNPGLFTRIRVLQTLPNGIMIYGGPLKTDPEGSGKAQAYRFPIDKFTVAEAKEWLREHNIRYIMFEKATGVQAFSASIKVNPVGLRNAKNLISRGKINNTASWEFTAADGNKILGNDNWNNYSKWHLAIDTSKNEETKAYYKFPFGKNGELYRSALRAIRVRAGQQRQANISNAAGKLFDQLKEKVEAFGTNISLLSQILSFDQSEIISHIPKKILAKIKEKNSHPFFTMYSICHEGVSEPIVVGEGSKKISWPRKAIESIKNIITRGIKLFKGHNADGKHAGRRVIGKVIHSFEEEIDGILHHLIIAYHKPDTIEEVKKFDVCSQEAFWNIINVAGNFVADTIDKLTGIALENSKNKIPAFAGAKRLGYIQAFNLSGKDSNNSSGKDEKNIQGEKNMPKDNNQTVDQNFNPEGNLDNDFNQPNQNQQTTKIQQQVKNKEIKDKVWTYSELRAEIKRLGVYPSQIFEMEDIKRDREFVPIFNEIEILKEDKKKMEAKVNELNRTAALSTAPNRIDGIISENNVPSKVAVFIKKRFDKNKDSIPDLSDKGIKDFVEQQTGLFQDLASEVYPEFDMKTVDSDKNAEPEDMTKVENNELLDEDLDI